MTKLLSRSEILKADDLPTKDVEVPEWGGTVRVRSMTAKDRDAFEATILEAQRAGLAAPENVRARHAAACIVDEKGRQIFNEEDILALGQKSGAALARVYDAISSLNQLAPEHVEEAAKN